MPSQLDALRAILASRGGQGMSPSPQMRPRPQMPQLGGGLPPGAGGPRPMSPSPVRKNMGGVYERLLGRMGGGNTPRPPGMGGPRPMAPPLPADAGGPRPMSPSPQMRPGNSAQALVIAKALAARRGGMGNTPQMRPRPF